MKQVFKDFGNRKSFTKKFLITIQQQPLAMYGPNNSPIYHVSYKVIKILIF